MSRALFFFFAMHVLAAFFTAVCGQHSLIPSPYSFQPLKDSFLLNEDVCIQGWDEKFFVQKKIEAFTNILPRAEAGNRVILFEHSSEYKEESYYLKVTADTVRIIGKNHRAHRLALQSLLQLFDKKNNAFIGCEVYDEPLFTYRAMHLDVSRHFFSKTVLKQYIALLASLKMNTLHLHLTDDQGWRIEIKKYPRLTEVGAWRKEKDGSTYGGFYTQEDLKEIVRYAHEHGIEIIPEIEMPGHSSAAIAAYPFLSCHGKTIQVPNTWGIKKHILCPTDSTLQFLKDVLDEVCDIFPSKFIHIGGDEVPKWQWRKSPEVKKLKKDKNLKNYTAVHAYLIQEIEKHLALKHRRIMAWGEVMKGYVSDSVVVMSWLSKRAGVKAARQGKQVVMAPRFYCYFDYPQSIKDKKHAIWMTYTPLRKVYRFTPYTKNMKNFSRCKIMGGEAAVWTEFITNETQLLHQVMPRVAALSEALWSHQKNFRNFEKRLKNALLYPRN
jgi:hexosaminidase